MSGEIKPWGMEDNTFLMLMHLSQLASYLIPGVGLVLPIIMWATNKDKSPVIDQHGKVILNWMISSLIYAVVCAILIFVVIGIFGLIALGIMNLVFVILGGVKANEGTLWAYPLSIKFFTVQPEAA